MILRTETVEQTIDGGKRATFVKDVVMTRGPHPLGMVRKRSSEATETRGTVLLLHGFGQNRYAWHTSVRSFSCHLAAEGWDVFNVDLRGHGRSAMFAEGRSRVLHEYVQEDVPALAEEALRLSGHRKLFLVGHSMGGLIAYSVGASRLRDRVRGIASIGSPYRFGLGSRTLAALSEVLTAVRYTGLFDANPILPLGFIGGHMRKRRSLWDSRAVPMPVRVWAPGSVESDVLDEYLRRAFDVTSLQVAFDIIRFGQKAVLRGDGGRLDYRTAFEWLDRPLLVIGGTRDTLAPPQSVRPAYEASRSSDKTYREFPLGHIDMLVGRGAPSTVWPLVHGWMSRR
ncbi:MAG: alpha/beta hydrolase [Myxococcota bacterium]